MRPLRADAAAGDVVSVLRSVLEAVARGLRSPADPPPTRRRPGPGRRARDRHPDCITCEGAEAVGPDALARHLAADHAEGSTWTP